MLREAGETLGDYDDLTTPQEKKLGQLVLEKVNSIQIHPMHCPANKLLVQFRLLYSRPLSDCRAPFLYHAFQGGQELLELL